MVLPGLSLWESKIEIKNYHLFVIISIIIALIQVFSHWSLTHN